MSAARPCALLAIWCSGVVAPAFSADPVWWSDPATTIFVGPPQNVSNWSLANVGQLKHVATQANTYLDARLSSGGGSGEAVDTICQFTNSENWRPLNLGQLKNVAQAFYDRLAQIHFNWRTKTTGIASPIYPWTNPGPPENAPPANIGQLKNVFSFEIPSSFLSANTDGDGLADWWEYGHFGNLTTATSSTDQDGDGLTNGQEVTIGSNPLAIDTDADGLTDPREGTLARNPLVPDHPAVGLVLLEVHDH
jgi:hypothetical protein